MGHKSREMLFTSSDQPRQALLLAQSLTLGPQFSFRGFQSGMAWVGGLPLLSWSWFWHFPALWVLLAHTHPKLCLGLAQSPRSPPLLSPGVVSEQTHEGQASAAGHDMAAPGGPRLLHVHDEPRGGRGRPALSLPVAPAPALLLARGPGRSVRGLGRRFALQRPTAPARHVPRAVAALPATRTAVRLPPPTALPRPSARTGCLGRWPLLLPCLPQRPDQWAGTAGRRSLGLHLCLRLPLGLLPHVRPLRAQQGLLGGAGPERGGAPHQIRGRPRAAGCRTPWGVGGLTCHPSSQMQRGKGRAPQRTRPRGSRRPGIGSGHRCLGAGMGWESRGCESFLWGGRSWPFSTKTTALLEVEALV